MKKMKMVIEKHTDGFVAYPLELQGIVVGEGDSYEEVFADVKSAICFHGETFDEDALNDGHAVLDAFLTDAEVPI